MEITNRKENALLNRVEIEWQWRHTGQSTPSRYEMVAAVTKLEPGSTMARILIKEVDTRFGQPLTTGTAYIYGSREDLEKSPKYILERHAELAPPAVEATEEAAEEAADDDSSDGGDE